MRYEVEYYEKSDGERPAEAFILGAGQQNAG